MKVVFSFSHEDKIYKDGALFSGEMTVNRSLAEWYISQGRGNVVEVDFEENDTEQDVISFVNHLAYHEVMRAYTKLNLNLSQEELRNEIEREAKRLAKSLMGCESKVDLSLLNSVFEKKEQHGDASVSDVSNFENVNKNVEGIDGKKGRKKKK